VEDTAAAVASLVENALATGAIDDHTSKDVEHALDEATKKYGEGDLEGALGEIAGAQAKVREAVDKGEATGDAGAAIIGALDQLAIAMQASTPEGSSEDGGPPQGHEEGGPPGKAKGHDKDKD
jgi:hypothetical protein